MVTLKHNYFIARKTLLLSFIELQEFRHFVWQQSDFKVSGKIFTLLWQIFNVFGQIFINLAFVWL